MPIILSLVLNKDAMSIERQEKHIANRMVTMNTPKMFKGERFIAIPKISERAMMTTA